MTANTIAYWNYLETVRANKAREKLTYVQNEETNRHNLATEGLGLMNYSLSAKSQQETVRANLAREAEVRRSNLAQERLGVLNLEEAKRAHLATESLRSAELAESTRSHIANEMITATHNNRTDTVAERNALVNENQLALNAKSVASQVELNSSRTKLNQQESNYNTSTFVNRIKEQAARANLAMTNVDIADVTKEYAAQLSQANLDSITAGTDLKEKDLEYYNYNMMLNGIGTIGNFMRSMTAAANSAGTFAALGG